MTRRTAIVIDITDMAMVQAMGTGQDISTVTRIKNTEDCLHCRRGVARSHLLEALFRLPG